MKKLKHSLMKLAFVATIFVFAGIFVGKANADTLPETVTLTLHKLAFDKGTLKNGSIANDGAEHTDNFGGTPLPGSEFTLIDVTAKYDELIKTSDRATVIGQIQNAFKGLTTGKELPYGKKVELTTQENPGEGYKNPAYTESTNGQVSFLKVPAKQNGKDAVYVLAETNSSLAVNSELGEKAVPMVVALPVFTPNTDTTTVDSALSTIHLYPKNELVNVNVKKKDTEGITFDKNTPIKYTLEFQVPAEASTKLEIHDAVKPKGALALFQNENHKLTVKIKDTNTPVEADWFTQTNGVNSDLFALEFKGNHIKELVGRTIQVEYSAVITGTAPIDTAIQNIAYMITDNHDTPVNPEEPYNPKDPKNPIFPNVPTDPTKPFNPFEPTDPTDPNNPNPPVFTGGYKFIKKDLNSDKALAGAEFVVTNGKKFAQFGESNNFTGWVDEKDATKIISSADGTFDVKGLNSGDYQLKETKAPEGYALPKDTFNFTVATGTQGKTYLDGEKASAYTVNNVKKGLLPSTGAKGIYGFLAIGLVFFGGAFIFYKRAKKPSEV